MRGTPWRQIPHKSDTRIPTHIDIDAESGGEGPEEPIVVVDGDEYESVEVPQGPEPTPRSGVIDKCRSCRAIGSDWKRPFAHSTRCRDRVMTRMFEDGDEDDRVNNATERSLREGVIDE